jgi:hypothetical protein
MGGGPRNPEHRKGYRKFVKKGSGQGGRGGGRGAVPSAPNFMPEEQRWKPQSSPNERTQLHEELMDLAWRSSPSFESVALSCLSQRAVEEAWARHMEMSELGLGPLRVTPFGSQAVGVSMPGGDLDMKVVVPEVCLWPTVHVPDLRAPLNA